jgi:hypothetical protein
MMTEPFRISGNHRITAQLILTVLGPMQRPVNDYRRLRGNCTPTPN